MTYINELNQFLAENNIVTVSHFLNANPHIRDWILEETNQYPATKLTERIYIILHGAPDPCPNGNIKKFNTFVKGYRKGCHLGNECQCANSARVANQRKTVLEKYGVTAVSQIPGIVEKRKNTSIKKYGVDHYTKTTEYQQQASGLAAGRTEEEKQSIQAKIKNTSLAKYGATHHMKTKSQQQKVQDTNKQRYGVGYPLQNPQIQQARCNALKKKFNTANPAQFHFDERTLDIVSNIDKFREFVTGKTRASVASDLGISYTTMYDYMKKYNAYELFEPTETTTISRFQQQIADYIKSMGIEISINDRTQIYPLEIDIWIPELQVGIECNGLYWHSEFSTGRDKKYHYNKFLKAKEHGITLISVYEDEWTDKQQKVKHRLQNILQKTGSKIYARNCTATEITAAQAERFIDQYHIQGHVSAKHCIALLYKDQIVAVMSFAKPRFNRDLHDYEIIRFCSSTSVVGGASKLFNYFKNNYSPRSVISYSDNRWGNGSVYQRLGFKNEACTVGYFYTDYRARYNRMQFQKHKLVEDGANKDKSEIEIMRERGFDRIWDCGQTLWIWHSIQ